MSDFPEEYRDGYVLFCGQRCLVDQRALIPRIETEELVKYSLKLLESSSTIDTIVDIGTGSGVIPYSIAGKVSRDMYIIVSDKSSDALDLARENFGLLKKPLKNPPLFLQGDLLMPVIQLFGEKAPETLLITANLPYVLAREVVGDLIYEPKMAFIGGEKTGFELYERFFEQLAHWKHRPKICHIVIEF